MIIRLPRLNRGIGDRSSVITQNAAFDIHIFPLPLRSDRLAVCNWRRGEYEVTGACLEPPSLTIRCVLREERSEHATFRAPLHGRVVDRIDERGDSKNV